jgi:hypothetical protein
MVPLSDGAGVRIAAPEYAVTGAIAEMTCTSRRGSPNCATSAGGSFATKSCPCASVAAQQVRNTGTLNDRDSGRCALVRWRPVRGGPSPQSPERRRGLLNCCADVGAGQLRTDTHDD